MQRVKELDSIRGLAAATIVIYHVWFMNIGLLGSAVDLFFVLSGYLITSILLGHPLSERFLLAFYARRGLRIWPIYYISLLILVVINPWVPRPGSLAGLPYFLSFTQNLPYYWSDTAPAFIPAFRHSWSLAIEEQFYLMWPVLLWLVGRKGLPWAAMGLIVLAVTMRALNFNSWILATHCDGLALGALLAGLLEAPSEAARWRLDRSLFLAVGLAAVGFWAGSAVVVRLFAHGSESALVTAVQSIRPLCLNLVFFALVGLTVLGAGDWRMGLLRDRRLVYLGQISYGLYLYHHIVLILWDDFAAARGLGNHIGYDLVKIGVSLAIAALSNRIIEQPILALKGLFPYRAPAARAAVSRERFARIGSVEAG
jgi:peptidoglycan/LPS O-acetylase OafA/YrhL